MAQCAPLSGVPITYGEESRLVPAATHDAPFGQLTAFKLAPERVDIVDSQSVKSVVLMEAAPPSDWIPTATQVVSVAHEIEFKTVTFGLSITVHVSSFSVPMTAAPPFTTPMAAQVSRFEHDTIDKELVPVGAVCGVQFEPSVVAMI